MKNVRIDGQGRYLISRSRLRKWLRIKNFETRGKPFILNLDNLDHT